MDAGELPQPCGCPAHRAAGLLVPTAAWLTAALAALAVAAVPFDAGESLCGAWGCFPPLPALAAMHLFTGVLFAAAVWAARRHAPRALRPAGAVLLLAGLTLGPAYLAADVHRWRGWVPDDDRHYWPNRVAYKLATAADVPLVQALAAGAACLVLSPRRRHTLPEPQE